ncbi:hypothetical protein QBC32DRAFT_362058 [Pseudoneurospora amorphoporcata]|uniref:Uncharacterized protein n=1 Tax=Pseudoneurospora amorphoporcata TaxID=241081 RepID=A0AAN6NU59_9PEZI|nr:hypothetical protein QBC32DRAFT_362058 [Pseudoneurospora amorphoporcata]
MADWGGLGLRCWLAVGLVGLAGLGHLTAWDLAAAAKENGRKGGQGRDTSTPMSSHCSHWHWTLTSGSQPADEWKLPRQAGALPVCTIARGSRCVHSTLLAVHFLTSNY